MKIELDKYKIISKIFIGTNLKIVFQNIYDINDKKVLELQDVIGIIDMLHSDKEYKTIRIDEKGYSFNLDLSIRLNKPDVVNYPEVFIFEDTSCVIFHFRAVAKFIEFKEYTVINY